MRHNEINRGLRYAIVSDIHANLQAWNAVLSDIALQAVDRIICLGDIVGYGADPAPVLESAYRHVDGFALGNHDAVIAGSLSDQWFTAEARRSLDWTSQELDNRARQFLAKAPLCLTGPGFRCVHGEFSRPGAFDYIHEPEDAMESWRKTEENLLFVGHTHLPGIFLLGRSGTPHLVQPQDFVMEAGKRYLVNPGSVGLPRAGDAIASYCVYDSAAATVSWRRIPFDLDACRHAIRRAGLPEEPFTGFSRDPRSRLREVREPMRFSPPAASADHARPTVDTAALLNPIIRRSRRWRILALTTLGLMTIAAAWSGTRLWHRSQLFDARPATPLAPVSPRAGDITTNLARQWTWHDQPNRPPREWRVIRHRATAQDWSFPRVPGEEEPVLTLTSRDAGGKFRLESRPVVLPNENSRLQARARFRKSDDFTGYIGLVFDVVKQAPAGAGKTIPAFHRREPRMQRRDGWIKAQTTLGFPPDAHMVVLAIEGRFAGEVEIKSVNLNLVE